VQAAATSASFSLGVPFDEGGDEAAYRFFIEPMEERPHLAVHDVIGHLRER